MVVIYIFKLKNDNILGKKRIKYIENLPLTNFSNSINGTYYSGYINKKIIFVRNTIPTNCD